MCGSISFFTYPKGFSRVSADKKTCTYTGPCQDVDISKKGWQKELKYERPKYPCQVFIGITKARLFAGSNDPFHDIFLRHTVLKIGTTFIVGHIGSTQLIPVTALIEGAERCKGLSISKRGDVKTLFLKAIRESTSTPRLPPCLDLRVAIKRTCLSVNAKPGAKNSQAPSVPKEDDEDDEEEEEEEEAYSQQDDDDEEEEEDDDDEEQEQVEDEQPLQQDEPVHDDGDDGGADWMDNDIFNDQPPPPPQQQSLSPVVEKVIAPSPVPLPPPLATVYAVKGIGVVRSFAPPKKPVSDHGHTEAMRVLEETLRAKIDDARKTISNRLAEHMAARCRQTAEIEARRDMERAEIQARCIRDLAAMNAKAENDLEVAQRAYERAVEKTHTEAASISISFAPPPTADSSEIEGGESQTKRIRFTAAAAADDKVD